MSPLSYAPKKLIAIVGPTATGKTDLALKLARKFQGEIISVDSRAIYRGLPIGTTSSRPSSHPHATKIHDRQFLSFIKHKGIKQYLVGILDPQKSFSAYDFAKLAAKIISKIKTPILVGGTGFWIDALLQSDLLKKIPPNLRLRKKLDLWSVADLFAELKKLDPKRAKTVERKNKRRLIRAIEIATGSQNSTTNYNLRPTNYSVLFLGLDYPNAILKKRIHNRFLKMLKLGLVSETKKLTRKVSKIRLREIGLVYPVVADYIDEKITRDEMIERSVNATYHYAKRQKTWFRKNKNIHWIKTLAEAGKLAKNFLR